MKLMLNLKTSTEIKALIKRYSETKLTYKEFKAELAKVMKANGISAKMNPEVKTLFNETLSKIETEFKNSTLGGKPELEASRKIVQEIQKSAESGFQRIDRAITNIVARAAQEGVKGDKDWRSIARTALQRAKLQEHHITTEIETAKATLDNTSTAVEYEAAGIEKLIYAGPSGTQRDFCIDHIGKTYTLAEVKGMVNQFGQPALYYCGGYNCRHRWDAVI